MYANMVVVMTSWKWFVQEISVTYNNLDQNFWVGG